MIIDNATAPQLALHDAKVALHHAHEALVGTTARVRDLMWRDPDCQLPTAQAAEKRAIENARLAQAAYRELEKKYGPRDT